MSTGFYADPFIPGALLAETIRLATEQAANRNTDNLALYKAACDDWVLSNTRNRNAGLSIASLPLQPLKRLVDDQGSIYNAPFQGLCVPTLPPANTTVSMGIAATGAAFPPDRTDLIIAMIRSLNTTLQDIKAVLIRP